MLIYKIICKLNDKDYVGKTTRSLEERIAEYLRNSRTSYIDYAIQKHGWENFSVEIIETCETLEQLNEREKFWIREFNCKKPNGYNLTDGGEGTAGGIVSNETHRKISKARTERKFHPLSKEHRKKFHVQTKGLNVQKNAAEVFPRDNTAKRESHIKKKHDAKCRQSVKLNALYVALRQMKFLNLQQQQLNRQQCHFPR